ncbi:MAG: hypothetical protein ACK4GL_05360 [Flavobacteriales bacterium]
MKTEWIKMFIAFSLIFSSCNGQETNFKNSKSLTDTASVSNNYPKENIKVNKEYDQNGNLIRYDSTYTYFYSNVDGNKAALDSIFNNFRNMFNHTYPFSTKPYFDNLFFQDSLLQYDFYKKDFFLNRYKQNMQQLDRLFLEMDSVKNKFFIEQFPEKRK